MPQISEVDHLKVKKLSSEGNTLAEKGLFDEAIIKFTEALQVLPPPRNQWEANTWLLSAIGDMFFLKEEFAIATKYFYDSLNSPEGINNPFINLRLGECLYNMTEFAKSKEYLLRAYMIDGKNIFNEEDKKYFDFIKDII